MRKLQVLTMGPLDLCRNCKCLQWGHETYAEIISAYKLTVFGLGNCKRLYLTLTSPSMIAARSQAIIISSIIKILGFFADEPEIFTSLCYFRSSTVLLSSEMGFPSAISFKTRSLLVAPSRPLSCYFIRTQDGMSRCSHGTTAARDYYDQIGRSLPELRRSGGKERSL